MGETDLFLISLDIHFSNLTVARESVYTFVTKVKTPVMVIWNWNYYWLSCLELTRYNSIELIIY